MPTNNNGAVLKKGQSLQDLVQALMSAESDIAGRDKVPPKASRVLPQDVELPDMGSILSRMPAINTPYWQPGIHVDPNASKGQKILQAFRSIIGTVNPHAYGENMRRNAFIEMNRKNEYSAATKMYESEMRRANLLRQADEARTRVLNENIDDYNKSIDKLLDRPKAWDILKGAIDMMKGEATGDTAASNRTERATKATLRSTNEFIDKTLPKWLSVVDQSAFNFTGGKRPTRELDPANEKDQLRIKQILNSPGFKSKLDISGADPVAVWKFLHDQYPDAVPPDANEWFGQKISPAIRTGGEKLPAPKSSEPIQTDHIDTQVMDGESPVNYFGRMMHFYGGNANKAYAHMLAAMYAEKLHNIDNIQKAVANTPEIIKSIKVSGADPQAVIQELNAYKEAASADTSEESTDTSGTADEPDTSGDNTDENP